MSYNFNKPLLQKDEPLYSYVKRAAVLNCLNAEQICSLLEIKSLSQTNVLNNIDKVIEIFNLKESPHELLTKHTEFTLQRFCMSQEEIKDIYEMFIDHNISYYSFFQNFNESLICPVCAKKELYKYGYPIKKIYINYIYNFVCPIHEVKTTGFNEFFDRIDVLKEPIKKCNDENDIAYSKWLMNLYNADINNPCLERTEKVLMPKVSFFGIDDYAITNDDSRILYHLSTSKSLSSFNYSQIHRILFLMFRNIPFDEFVDSYNKVEL